MIEEPGAGAVATTLQELASGNIKAMRRLYDATHVALFRVCFQVVREREAAEDILQEAYLKIWHRAPCFSPEVGGPMAWLTTIARNTSLDWMRARGRERRGTDRLAELIEPIGGANFMFARESDHQCAVQSIGELDQVSRELIHDAFVVGMTYSELADLRGLPLGTVKSRIRRGLQRVKQDMTRQ
jgi:RNA polymerase sigma-70 factor (ECF subfamily)